MSENIIWWQNKTRAGLVSAEMRTAKSEDYLASSKQMGTVDWLATPVASVASLLQSLRTVVSILLYSRFLMIIHWGFELIEFYMDLVTFVMDGLEATRWLRMSPELEKVLVIAISTGVFDFDD
ncbi:hypothetical protein JYQ62_20290 [Nostoc sp. UHCC 0702]|nr:hypothetical protein JYQ62_20290 [Nostoc sp. UHCC 0702]